MCVVSGKILDPNGLPYVNASIFAGFVGQSTTPGAGPYVAGGVPSGVFETIVTAQADSFANFAMVLTGNDVISPTPSQWLFSVLSHDGQTSFSVLITIAGSTQNITAALQAAAALLPVIGGNITAGTIAASGNISTIANMVSPRFNNVIWLDGVVFTTLAAAYAALPAGGGVVMVPPNYSETFTANLTLRSNAGFFFCGPASINQGTFQVIAPAGSEGWFIIGMAQNKFHVNKQVTFTYTGVLDAWVIGANTATTLAFTIANILITTTQDAANGIHMFRSGNFTTVDLGVAGNSSATNTGIGILCDGTGDSVSGRWIGPQVGGYKIGMQGGGTGVNAFNANIIQDFRSPGPAPVNNAFALDLEAASAGNFIEGGDIENYSGVGNAALNIGGNATSNFARYRNENCTRDLILGATTTLNEIRLVNSPAVITDNSTVTSHNSVYSNGQQIIGYVEVKRIRATQGTPLVAGDFNIALGPSWGSTASLTTVLGTDSAFVIIVTSAGVGQAANPTVVMTFHDGSWGVGTVPIPIRGDANNPATAYWTANTGPTVVTFIFNGTPVAGQTYQMNCIVMGR